LENNPTTVVNTIDKVTENNPVTVISTLVNGLDTDDNIPESGPVTINNDSEKDLVNINNISDTGPVTTNNDLENSPVRKEEEVGDIMREIARVAVVTKVKETAIVILQETLKKYVYEIDVLTQTRT
jgi:hypothetical protein